MLDQRRDDRNDSLDVVLLGDGAGTFGPEQGRAEHNGNVEGGHLCCVAVLGQLVQELKRRYEWSMKSSFKNID